MKEPDAAETRGSPPKVDPETLVLRARPPRVVRFRRSAIVALTVIALCGIFLAAWLAFRPRTFHLLATHDESSAPAKGPGDALNALPASYAGAPRLGPPLPGDLGPPILEHQRSLGEAGRDDSANAAARAAQAERERKSDEARRARESVILVGRGSEDRPPQASVPVPSPALPGPALAPSGAAGGDPQARKARFADALDRGRDVSTHMVRPPASPYLLSAGSVIAASLITGLRSDLPGLAIAQVTERVYDSPTGRLLLIPQGARLIGRYDSDVAFGQRRAFIVWQRIVFPDGRSLRLDNMPATDAGGYAGLEDEVDLHLGTLAKGAIISSLLGVGANLTFAGESDLVQAIRESTQQNVARAGDRLTSRNLSIPPTITIRPGTPVQLVVERDLVLAPSGN